LRGHDVDLWPTDRKVHFFEIAKEKSGLFGVEFRWGLMDRTIARTRWANLDVIQRRRPEK